ncbi:leucine-rich repeat domain-containing protein [Enterococcus sp. DIV1283b]|uniref:leucine-rich repeat domain-containing protein n=1 Tax=Enterococcus sp. DIV1283b TaxID=2774745 RepID=UPI003F203B6B
MKCKKIVATLMLSASVLGTVTPLVPTFAEENRQAVTQQEGVVPDSALRKVLNSALNQEENTTLTKEQLSSITEITGAYGMANGTLSSLEGLQYCTSLEKMVCSFDGTVTDFSILGTLAPHVEFGMMSEIDSNLNKTISMEKDGVITVDNPYKDANGDVMIPTKISNGGTYDQATNKIVWKDLDVTHDYDLKVEYDQTLAGINNSELIISAQINVDALANNCEEIKFNDSHLAAGLIKNLNEQQINGNTSRQLTDPIYENELQKLTKLDLSNQEIQDLSGLESCTNLQYLNLASNLISDNSNLSKVIELSRLAEIDLSDNQLTDVSVFCATKSLGTITVNNNKISNIDPMMLTQMSTLRHFNISGNFLTNFDFVTNWGDQLYQQDVYLWSQCSADATNQKVPEITAKVENNEIHVKNPLKGISKFTLSNNGTYDKETNTFIWKNIANIPSLTVSAEETNGTFKKGGTIQINIDQSQKEESATQTINIGGQGIGGYSDHSHDSGFSRVSLEVKDHKASLVKHSDYQFHWSGWKTSKYASIKLTDPNGNVLYDQAWKGNEAVKGNGYKKFGAFAQYDLPEGSTVEIYHAEGPGHRLSTNDNDNLKTKLEKTGYTYTYKMQNNQLILTNVDENANGKHEDGKQVKNLFHNPEFKLARKENHWLVSDWSVATIADKFDGVNGFNDTFMDKEPAHNIGQDSIKFKDGSDLYRVGTKDCDFIGVNEKTQKVTLATSCNGTRSTCFSQTVDTKPGQKYHFSIDIESNKVTKDTIGGKKEISEFSDKDFVIECKNEDGSHLVTLIPHSLKKNGNTYSVDNLSAKSNKIKFYIFLGNSQGLYNAFNSAQISHLSLTENK